jgi:hypothetical protein
VEKRKPGTNQQDDERMTLMVSQRPLKISLSSQAQKRPESCPEKPWRWDFPGPEAQHNSRGSRRQDIESKKIILKTQKSVLSALLDVLVTLPSIYSVSVPRCILEAHHWFDHRSQVKRGSLRMNCALSLTHLLEQRFWT